MDQKYLNECLNYDKQTGVFTWKKRPLSHFQNEHGMNIWNTKYSGAIAGTIAESSKGYFYKRLKIAIKSKQYMAHRLAWIISFGQIPKRMSIDHIDGDPLNNQINNLRLVTHSQNHRNRKIPSNNKSGYQGVRQRKNKWQARIKIMGKEKSLGYFSSIEEAVEARKKYAIQNGFTERHG